MKLRDFDLNLLVAFDALLEECSVSKAAARMFVTQSAMSHSLNRLRELLDDPILVRTNKGMVPTQRAQAMVGQVKELLHDIYTLVNQSQTFDPATSVQRFVVVATDYIEYMILPALMERIYRLAPSIDLHVLRPSDRFPEAELENRKIDLLLGFNRDIEVPARFKQSVLFEDNRVCLLRRDHPHIKRKLSLQQYLGLDHIRVSPTAKKTGFIDEILAQKGMKRRIALLLPHFLYAPHILQSTDMIFSPPLRIAQQFTQISPLKILPMPLELQPYQTEMVWSPLRETDPAHHWLRDQIMAISAEITATTDHKQQEVG